MATRALFGISIILSFLARGLVVGRYIWPALRGQSRVDALRSILVLHSFRFVGLAFLIPGAVSPDLPATFARPAAYGAFATAILALLAIATLRSKPGIIHLWTFSVLGGVDLLHASYGGNRIRLSQGDQAAAYFILTVSVLPLLITHGLVFRRLLNRDRVDRTVRLRRGGAFRNYASVLVNRRRTFEALTTPNPKPRYLAGRETKALSWLAVLVPDRIRDRILTKRFGLPRRLESARRVAAPKAAK